MTPVYQLGVVYVVEVDEHIVGRGVFEGVSH